MSPSQKRQIAVIGSGSWGTALAVLLAGNGHNVKLWGRNSEHQKTIQQENCNQQYLPDVKFPDTLSAEIELADAIRDSNEILLVVPSAGFKSTLENIKPLISTNVRLAIATKGLEPGNLKLLHQVAEEILTEKVPKCIISGPTFAKEVAMGLPTAITVASNSENLAQDFAEYLSNEHFRAYTSNDIIGVEVGGAVKNVMAIAAGIADGLGFGANTRAALITRGLAEITRFGTKLGGQQETFMGLAGLGDLVLTCTDNQSRNRRVGLGLASGKTLKEVLAELGQVAEGVTTTEKIYYLANKLDIEMPIVEQVYQVIYQQKAPEQAVRELIHRAIRSEN